MLCMGCNSGAVSVPMASFLELTQLTLHSLPSPRLADSSLAKHTIPSDTAHVSTVDVCKVALSLQVSLQCSVFFFHCVPELMLDVHRRAA
jgi:hypothetical protein